MQHPRNYHDSPPFYRFYTYQPDIFSDDRKIDPVAKRIVEKLFDATICPEAEAWGRYLLLIIWLWQVPETSSFNYLTLIIQGLDELQHPETDSGKVNNQVELNALLFKIHKHILRQWQNPDTQGLFAKLPVYMSQLMRLYLWDLCIAAGKKWYSDPQEGFSVAINQLATLPLLIKDFDLLSEKKIDLHVGTILRSKVKDQRFAQANNNKRVSRYTSIAGKIQRGCTKHQFRSALQAYGLNSIQLKRYELIKFSFGEIYQEKQEDYRKPLPPPSDQQIDKMCVYCNRRRSSLDMLPEFTVEEIRKTLDTIVKALDEYAKSSQELSIDRKFGAEDAYTLLDTPKLNQEQIDPLNAAIDNELEALIWNCVRDTFATLKEEQKLLLLLTYGFDINQAQVGYLLANNVTQTTASRKISKCRLIIARTLITKLKDTYPEIFKLIESNSRKQNSINIKENPEIPQIFDKKIENSIAKYIKPKVEFLVQDIGRRHLVEAIQQLDEADRQQIIASIDDLYLVDSYCDSTPYSRLLSFFIRIIRQHWNIKLAEESELKNHFYQFIRNWLDHCIHSLL
jgi:hypothetical protein